MRLAPKALDTDFADSTCIGEADSVDLVIVISKIKIYGVGI
jgi:hypothetical protein